MGEELDMINRDPNSLHDKLEVDFAEVIGEPEGSHSPDCAWRCGYKCFTGAKKCCYAFMTVLTTWCVGLCWGCEFAYLTFCMIWMISPFMRMFVMIMGTCEKVLIAFTQCCIGPMCASIGMLFSNIKVTQVSQ